MLRKTEIEGLDPTGWMITFSDLLNLLLVFFVMIVAMSSTNKERLKDAFQNFIFESKGIPEEGATEEKGVAGESGRELRQEILKSLLTIKIPSGEAEIPKDLSGMVEVVIDKRGVVIRLAEKLTFEPGSSTIKPAAKKVIESVAPMIKRLNVPIEVEGHTDSTPIKSARFASNWELSIDRATKIVRLFEQCGVEPRLLSAVGYAHLRPIADNEKAEDRAKNRRVEIVIKVLEGKNG